MTPATPQPEVENPFGAYGHGFETRRSWLSSLAASSGVYLALGLLAASITATTTIIERKKPVEVKFVEKTVKPPPPPVAAPKPVDPKPATPPKVETKQAAPAAVVPKDMKVRKLDKPPPAKELIAPTDVPLEAAPEGDASQDSIGVYGDGAGDAAGLEGGQGSGIPGGLVTNPDVLAQATVRPEPPYPDDMLVAGRQATVVLKCVVLADGTVFRIDVVSGEEPFLAAAMETIKTRWKFEPGKLRGRNVNTMQTVTVNFKIMVG